MTIRGPTRLAGSIQLQGDKTAALLLIAAACAIESDVRLERLPQVRDTEIGLALAACLQEVRRNERCTIVGPPRRASVVSLPPALCQSIRHTMSFVAAGLVLGKEVEFSTPGGDAFCSRPIDLHLAAIREFGAEFSEIRPGRVRASPGRRQSLSRRVSVAGVGPSVGATCTALILASGADAESQLYDASSDPQVVAVRDLFQAAGCRIVESEGVLRFYPGRCSTELAAVTPPDRIVFANIALLAGMCGSGITVTGVTDGTIDRAIGAMLSAMNISYRQAGHTVEFAATDRLHPVAATARPFPGLSTDILPLAAAAASCAHGTSRFVDCVYPDRTSHLPLLARFGINSAAAGSSYEISGDRDRIRAAVVAPTDIRAAAAVVQVSLVAEGTSTIVCLGQILRGYERWIERLRHLGAVIGEPA